MKLDKKLRTLDSLRVNYELYKCIFVNILSFKDEELAIYICLISKRAEIEIRKNMFTNQYYITVVYKRLKFMG